MVLERTIHSLKERPRHEREAVAFWVAVAVVLVLLLGWGVYFFRSLSAPNLQPVSDAYTQALQQAQSQQSQVQRGPDDTGWVSSASQTSSAAAPSEQIQMIQEEDVPRAENSTQSPTQ